MNKAIQIFQAPDPVAVPLTENPKFSELATFARKMGLWAREFHRKVREQLEEHRQQLNSQVQGWSLVASAASIAPTSSHVHVTGSATITTIIAPSGFSGPLWLIADGAFSLAAGGNIALARGPFTVGQRVGLAFDPSLSMWFPT